MLILMDTNNTLQLVNHTLIWFLKFNPQTRSRNSTQSDCLKN